MTPRTASVGFFLLILLLASASNRARGALVYQYDLNIDQYNASNQTYAGEPSGAPTLQTSGGTAQNTSFSFGSNQGLTLKDALTGTTDDYSLLVEFEFDTVSGYRKIIDFKDLLQGDPGLYVHDGKLEFFGASASGVGESHVGTSSVFAPNQMARLVITRSNSSPTTNRFTGYVNGVRQFFFSDTSGVSVFGAPSNTVRFFKDDTAGSGNEASAGTVERIWVYDAPLTETEVANLENTLGPAGTQNAAVPEPSSLALAGVGLVVLFGLQWKRRNRQGANAGE